MLNKKSTKKILQGLLVPVIIIAAWQIFCSLGMVRPQLLPSPWAVLLRWYEYLAPMEAQAPEQSYFAWLISGELLQDLFASFYRVVVGFAVGTVLALPFGLVMGASNKMYALFNPMFQVLRPIPPIAYIPLSILWFGLGNPPAIFLISLGAFFPVLMNTVAGVRQVDAIYLRAAQNLGASKSTIFRRVILPAATPYILVGARIAMGTAFICVIVAEMIAVNSGLGFRILEAREYFWTDKVIAGMFTIGLLGLAIDLGMDALNARLLRWHRGIGG